MVSRSWLMGSRSPSPARSRTPPSTRPEQPPTTTTSVLSWNIALCKPSNEATWSRDENARRIEQCITEKGADVLCIQEAPSCDYWEGTALGETYNVVGSVETHCGFTMVLVKASTLALRLEIRGAPAIGAIVDGVAYISMHLAPTKINANERIKQMCNIMASMPPSVQDFVVVGDSNMRKTEDTAFEGIGLGDAWKMTGQLKRKEHTWNSHINRYHLNGFEFISRFDRAYMRGLHCKAFDLVANTKSDGAFLSDHFGILLTVSK